MGLNLLVILTKVLKVRTIFSFWNNFTVKIFSPKSIDSFTTRLS